MSQLSIMEHARVVRLVAGRVRRRSVARVLGSPLLRWRYGAPIADAMAMVPQDLRPSDPSLVDELARGQLGLAGAPAKIGRGSPFQIEPPTPAWAQALHGFGWLRHLRAAGTDAAATTARQLVVQWIDSGCERQDVARNPEVAGRRIVSWITNADMLLDGVDRATFDKTAQSLVGQLAAQSAAWGSAADGYPRLVALIGVVFGDLCILGHERRLAVSEARLEAELERQVLPDGGHVSRNASVLLELMLDLLPLRQCFATRNRKLPTGIDEAMTRMMRMLAFMRLGNGALARFNGVGAPAMAELSTVLAYAPATTYPLLEAPHSRYARLESAGLVLIADVGVAPPLELAGQAQAGALSFELSAGPQALFVNGGMPGAAENRHVAAARATASHNALTFGDKSTARLLRTSMLEHLAGCEPIRTTGNVTALTEREADGSTTLSAVFDGWSPEHGLLHSRRLTLGPDGTSVRGRDSLAGVRGPSRLAHDVPFAVRFHLPPGIGCEVSGGDGQAAILLLPNGLRWCFEAAGGTLSLEPSIHFADPSGVVRSRQLVIRGSCWGETNVEWSLTRQS